MPLALDAIRAHTRELVHHHRRLYTMQSELESLLGLNLDMTFYEGLLFPSDEDPISDEEIDEALGNATIEDASDAAPGVVDAFCTLFPQSGEPPCARS